MLKSHIVLILVILLYIKEGFSQIEHPDSTIIKKHAIGVSVNNFSGSGLTYRYYPSRYGIQVTGYGLKNHEVTRVVLGGSLMRTIKSSEKFRFFLHVSAAEFYKKSREYNCHYDPVTQVIDCFYTMKYRKNFCAGTGIGIEFFTGKTNISYWYGIGFFRNFRDFSMLGGGISLIYLF